MQRKEPLRMDPELSTLTLTDEERVLAGRALHFYAAFMDALEADDEALTAILLLKLRVLDGRTLETAA